ncbi:hypothetical protein [Salmonella phage STWB21]|uniref:Uncharacterized protein n=1 Tax=Salmonella phage STWB21 TaxID=2815768 RepID=A0A8A6RI20_9CAUD|nr:hypothetical protein [Salmonella phage STWB21]
MSKLTDLLKAGDVKYLQRDSWENNTYSTTIVKVDVDNNDIIEFTWWWSKDGRTNLTLDDASWKTTELTLDEALADDWEIVELDM